MKRSAGRLQQRRGAVLVFIALSMTFIMAMLAFVVEISRLMADASELQSLTDASALAGAYGLQKVRSATYTTIGDSTATLNKVEGAAQTVTYKFGKWNGTTFDSSNAVTLANADAVQATATLTANHFFGGFLGTTNSYSIKRSSIAWMGGSINSTSCQAVGALDRGGEAGPGLSRREHDAAHRGGRQGSECGVGERHDHCEERPRRFLRRARRVRSCGSGLRQRSKGL